MMPYKDKKKRYEAICKSRAKKPDYYRLLGRNNKRKASRKGYYIQRRYGITIEDYNSLLAEQGNACATCGVPNGTTKSGRSSLHVDHNHVTGKVRGLLCARCNGLAGYIEKDESAELFARIGAYLAKNS